jgi:hypothetical protein
MLAGRAENLKRGGFDMFRSYWELDTLARHRNAEIASECARYTRAEQSNPHYTPTNLLTHLRHRLGIGLIELGRALAGCDAARGLPSPPAHPAT